MSETMKKLKSIPVDEIGQFLSKNKYNSVNCQEYQLIKEYVNADINSINDSFTGIILASKKILMNPDTNPILDEDNIKFDIKNGNIEEVILHKKRTDNSKGYVYLYNTINDNDIVHKMKAVLNQQQEILNLNIETIEPNNSYKIENITFDDKQNINIKIESTGNEESSNWKGETNFENGKLVPISVPDTLSKLADLHITMFFIFNSLKDGKYGFNYNEKQKKLIDKTFNNFIDTSPFILDKVKEYVDKNL